MTQQPPKRPSHPKDLPGAQIEVIAPNFKRRLSGVTATVARLIPVQARQIGIVATGPALAADMPSVPLWRIPFLPRRVRVWHARRNNEMLFGLLLRAVCRMQLKLVYTSASPHKRGKLTWWLASRMDAIVATTPQCAEVMPGTPLVIPHGIDTDRFAPGRTDLFGTGKDVLIGCFGRVRAMKGTHHFVTAMCRLLPDRPGVSAVIMGRITSSNADYADALRAQIDAAGLSDRIHFAEEIPEARMVEAYQALSLYVAPSLMEGFGLTVPEALACGVPVVGSDVGAFGQIITPACGRVVPVDDADRLTDAIADLLARDLAAMGAAGRARVQAAFSLQREADALCALYIALLSQH